MTHEELGKFGRNFDWRVVARGWSDEDFSDGVV